MIINIQNLDTIFTAFNARFTKGLGIAPSAYKDIAMTVPSNTREEVYGWLGQQVSMHEWVGPRIISNLAAHDFTIKNRDFANGVAVPRNDVLDDRYNLYGTAFEDLGVTAAEHPDQLVFSLLADGFTSTCYDGQAFFDADHPVRVDANTTESVSNVQTGASTPWYLLDTSRPVRPIVYQERQSYRLVRKDRPEDDNVFNNKEFIYGVDSRCNVGFGLWQLAFASKADLTADNYEAARQAMMSIKGDGGRPLNIKPNVLVVPPSLEGDAMRLLNNGTRVVTVDGTPVPVQNEWAGTAKPLVTAWLL